MKVPSNGSTRFRFAHAAHPNWRLATELCLAQLETQARQPGYANRANLGFVYLTDGYAEFTSEILTFLKVRSGVVHWVGTLGIGIAATGVEYFDEPALVILLADLPAGSFSIFSGQQPPPGLEQRTSSGALAAHTALVHADPTTPDLSDLIVDLSSKVESGWVFGGLSSARTGGVQIADRTLQPDPTYGTSLSGVVFSSEVHLLSAVTQGCWPLVVPALASTLTSTPTSASPSISPSASAAALPAAFIDALSFAAAPPARREPARLRVPSHLVTAASGAVLQTLDHRPALDVLLEELGSTDALGVSRLAQLANGLFAGLAANTHEIERGDYLVRHVIGLDPQQRQVILAAPVEAGQQLMFCSRDAQAARADLVRICTELREELEHDAALRSVAADTQALTRQIRGALYFSCLGRGPNLFGQPSTELKLIREHLGDIPMVGLFANGEIARNRLYGYAGVLSLFLEG